MASTIAEDGQKPFALSFSRGQIAALFAAEQRQWVLFTPICLMLGIGLWFYLPFNPQRQAAALFALALAATGFGFSERLRILIVSAGLLIFAGVAAAEYRSASVAAPRLHHWLSVAPIEGVVEEVIQREGGERVRIILRRDASDIDPEIRIRLSAPADLPAGIEPGARIRVDATLTPIAGPSLPGAYDSSRSAWFQGISASGRVHGGITLLQPAPTGAGWLDRMRHRLSTYIAETLGGDAGAVAVALTVGDQGRVRPALLDAMRISGLAHILSVSGFHISVVVAGSLLLFRRGLGLSTWLAMRVSVPRLAALCAGLIGTAYVLLSGAEVPAVRSILAAWVVLVALMLGRDPFSLRLIAFAAFVILLMRPESLLSASFQLSFAAVTALVALSQSRIGRNLGLNGGAEGKISGVKRFFWALLLSGIVAELVLTPLVLFHFGRTGAYGVLANSIAIPLTSFVLMPLLGLWLFLSVFGLGWLVEWALVPSLDLFAGIAGRVSTFPGAAYSLPMMPLGPILLIVLGGLLILLLAGRLQFAGVPLVIAGALFAVFAPRPDIFISSDGRQVGVVSDGHLHMLRGHRGGFLASSWASASDSPADAQLADLPGARCGDWGCNFPTPGGLQVVALTEKAEGRNIICAQADVVIVPFPLPAKCVARWQVIDQAVLKKAGAISIHSASRRMDSAGSRAGDQPWGISALPGERPRLLGGSAWTGVIVE